MLGQFQRLLVGAQDVVAKAEEEQREGARLRRGPSPAAESLTQHRDFVQVDPMHGEGEVGPEEDRDLSRQLLDRRGVVLGGIVVGTKDREGRVADFLVLRQVLGIEAVLHHGLVEVVGAGQVLEVEPGGRDDVEPGEPLALDDAMEGHAAVANDSRAR